MSDTVTIATVSFLLDESSTKAENNVERGLSYCGQAGKHRPDLVILPELFDVTGVSYQDKALLSEEVPGGPIFRRFAEKSAAIGSNLIITIQEREEEETFISSIVIGRDGRYIGKYRKTHLTPSELRAGYSRGDSYPVFDLDFGRIGILICMDLHFPEIWRILALKGAKLIAHPAMWRDYTGTMCEHLVNARAIDNQLYVVTSHFVRTPFLTGVEMGHSRIVDCFGRTRASTSHLPGLAVAEIDLDQGYENWAKGEDKERFPTLKTCFFDLRRPETYQLLVEKDEKRLWKTKPKKEYSK